MKARVFGKTVETAELWAVVAVVIAVFIAFYITGVVKFNQTLSLPPPDKRYRLYPDADQFGSIIGDWFRNKADHSRLPSFLLSIQVVDVQPNSNTCTLQVIVTNFWDYIVDVFLTDDKYADERAAVFEAARADTDLSLSSANIVTKPFSLLIGSTNRVYTKGQIATDFTVTVPIDGNPLRYPVDSYSVDLFVAAYGASAAGGFSADNQLYVGVQVDTADTSVFMVNPGDLKISLIETKSDALVIPIRFDRPGIFLVYPFFVLTAMLLILLAEFLTFFTLAVWMKREIQAPFVGIWSAMIFALPSFRNSLPGNPRMGCLLDWCGFFWTEAGAVMTFLGLGVRYVLDWPAPKPKPAVAPAPKPPPPQTAAIEMDPLFRVRPDPAKDDPNEVQYIPATELDETRWPSPVHVPLRPDPPL